MKNEEVKTIEEFNFYELFWNVVKDENDADIACMLHQICEYMFEGKDNSFDEQKFNVIWADLKDILSLQRQEKLNGKKASKYDRLWRHFSFKKSYFDKLKLMNLNDGGAYIRAICEQAFEGKIAKDLPPQAEKFYSLARLTLDISLERKKAGSKGGKSKSKSKPIKRTIDDLKALGCTGNLSTENPILEGVDLNKLYDHIKAHKDLQNLSLYKAVECYKNAVN